MWYYFVKIAMTTVLIVVVSEAAKRSSIIGALLASLPLVSVLAMVWLYAETRDAGKVAALAQSVFWLVLPSLVLFISLPILLKAGFGFYPSLLAGIALTVGAYFGMLVLLRHFGVAL